MYTPQIVKKVAVDVLYRPPMPIKL